VIPAIIRASSLSGYGDCPRRGAARLFRQEIAEAGFKLRQMPRGIGAIIGTAVHRGVEVGFGERARGQTPPGSLPVDAAMTELHSQIEGDVSYDGPRGATHNRRDAEGQVQRMTVTYWRDIAPAVNPILVEQQFQAEIAPGVLLSGHPDMVCREPAAIRDLKTGARRGNDWPQLGAYSLLARTHSLNIDEAHIDWLQRVAVGKPQPSVVSVQFNIAQAEMAAYSIVQHIVHDLTTFRQGDEARHIAPGDPWAFMPNPSSRLCSRKWCPAHSTEWCHEGKPE
jgi:hypothetical protein